MSSSTPGRRPDIAPAEMADGVDGWVGESARTRAVWSSWGRSKWEWIEATQ